MKVTYIEHMGSDLSVVNAARVSFAKESSELSPKDIKLLGYLAREGHEIPFAHPHITLHIEAPIIVRAQLFKHKIGFVESEVSRRYITEEPTFYTPKSFRKSSPNKKQGSLDEEVDHKVTVKGQYEWFMSQAIDQYNWLLKEGVCPEQARLVLPQGVYTQWRWTGSLLAYYRMVSLRSSGDAQKETQEIASQVSTIMEGLYPEAWKALRNNNKENPKE